jgi:hypothetical protein
MIHRTGFSRARRAIRGGPSFEQFLYANNAQSAGILTQEPLIGRL